MTGVQTCALPICMVAAVGKGAARKGVATRKTAVGRPVAGSPSGGSPAAGIREGGSEPAGIRRRGSPGIRAAVGSPSGAAIVAAGQYPALLSIAALCIVAAGHGSILSSTRLFLNVTRPDA